MLRLIKRGTWVKEVTILFLHHNAYSIYNLSIYSKKKRFHVSEDPDADVFYIKKVFIKISQNSQENTCARDSFLIKLQAWALQLY